MVLLTMTPGIVRALRRAEEASPDDFAKLQRPEEPPLAGAKPGSPVSHSQLIDLSKLLKQLSPGVSSSNDSISQHQESSGNSDRNAETSPNTANATIEPIPTTLSSLLHNTKIYTPPPPPQPAKSPQYHALMSRLRVEQERQSYERMLRPPPTRESFSQRFPQSDFSLGSLAPRDSEEDDLSYEEVHRQIILIINILISIVCVACFIWVAARHWSVGKRLGLSMGGSFGVAVAEVAVYGGYVRKVREAKRAEKKKPEIKEIVKSWVLDGGGEKEAELVGGVGKDGDGDVRKRKGKHR